MRRLLILGAALAVIAVAPAATSSTGTRCGVERWNVKTLQDSAAAGVHYTPKPTNVHALVSLTIPAGADSPSRVPNSAEDQTWKLSGIRLIAYKQEADQDFHLVLRSPVTGETMIAEIPDPACAPASFKLAAFEKVRTDFLAEVGTPSRTHFTTTDVAVRVTGVGFFDRLHHQRGVAPNGIELHPLLSFRVLP